ncbi:MAG: nucleotidyl transferase AbiEii/AbiGii toxin family protein [Bacilli bacterium]|nr:nucleotidyl transferase AbiEii/AbiGii toxin family protein [Bacilli bacterium]
MINQDRLKSLINNKTKGDNTLSIQLFQMFFFEHILERISKSEYKKYIILKGGLLLSSIIGEESRTTKDMDATLKVTKLSKEKIIEILENIFMIHINDNINYKIINISEIRLEDDYEGYRINVLATLDKLKVYLQLEFTTGDIITPREIEYGYNSIFENKKIYIMAYPLETQIAEKFETCINRNILNTRMKDFYDLYKIDLTKVDSNVLFKSMENTFKKRETNFDLEYLKKTVIDIKNSNELKSRWLGYIDGTPYAKDISYEDVMVALLNIVKILEEQFVQV